MNCTTKVHGCSYSAPALTKVVPELRRTRTTVHWCLYSALSLTQLVPAAKAQLFHKLCKVVADCPEIFTSVSQTLQRKERLIFRKWAQYFQRYWPCLTNGSAIIAFLLRRCFSGEILHFWQSFWGNSKFRFDIQLRTWESPTLFDQRLGNYCIFPAVMSSPDVFPAIFCIFWGSLTYKVLPWHPFWENSKFRFYI